MEIYGRVRRAVCVEGRSQRAVAREFGLSRETVRKMLQYAVPPGYPRQQPIRRPKLGPWLGVIDAILNDDKQRPAKQRHTPDAYPISYSLHIANHGHLYASVLPGFTPALTLGRRHAMLREKTDQPQVPSSASMVARRTVSVRLGKERVSGGTAGSTT